MKKLLPLLLGCTVICTGTAFASGPGAFPSPFKDFTYHAESYDKPELIPWYADAAVHMYDLGIVKGYDDKTFRANNNVNRGELVTMLSRLYELIRNPYTKEWGVYKNDFYTVWYPQAPGTSHQAGDDGCSSYMKFPFDIGYPVVCHDLTSTNLEEAIARNGSQFVEGDKRRELRETFMLNGRPATRVVVTTLDDPQWYAESVFVADESRKKLYELSNGAIRDPNFENFYLSFKVQ